MFCGYNHLITFRGSIVTSATVFLVPNSPRLVTTGTVTVKVGDVNDNAPVFERERYEARIGELQRTNTIVTTVTADDIDYGVNKAVS